MDFGGGLLKILQIPSTSVGKTTIFGFPHMRRTAWRNHIKLKQAEKWLYIRDFDMLARDRSSPRRWCWIDSLNTRFSAYSIIGEYWSAADQVESSLIPEVGLPDQSLSYANIPVYCAHPHAWVLYCWFYLKERDFFHSNDQNKKTSWQWISQDTSFSWWILLSACATQNSLFGIK